MPLIATETKHNTNQTTNNKRNTTNQRKEKEKKKTQSAYLEIFRFIDSYRVVDIRHWPHLITNKFRLGNKQTSK